ncbi:hypothetical protein AgCh_035195 [Apium graveolens]
MESAVDKMSDKWCLEKRSTPVVEDDTEAPFSEDGCLSIVVLGASGDLAKKKTFPALFNLYHQGFLQSHKVYIFGYARTNISDDDLRYRIRGYLTPNKNATQGNTQDVSKFLQLNKVHASSPAGSSSRMNGHSSKSSKVMAHLSYRKMDFEELCAVAINTYQLEARE